MMTVQFEPENATANPCSSALLFFEVMLFSTVRIAAVMMRIYILIRQLRCPTKRRRNAA